MIPRQKTQTIPSCTVCLLSLQILLWVTCCSQPTNEPQHVSTAPTQNDGKNTGELATAVPSPIVKPLSKEETLTQRVNELIAEGKQGNTDAFLQAADIYKMEDFPGRNLYKSGELVIEAALAGNVEAMVRAGDIYKDGLGYFVDEQGAIDWYEKAAEQRNARASWELLCILSESPEEGDRKKGLDLLMTAANDGYPAAQVTLGTLYITGEYVEKDESKSKELLNLGLPVLLEAAKEGDTLSQKILGSYYLESGKEDEIHIGTKWIYCAAASGDTDAQYWAGRYIDLEKLFPVFPADAKKYCEQEVSANVKEQDETGIEASRTSSQNRQPEANQSEPGTVSSQSSDLAWLDKISTIVDDTQPSPDPEPAPEEILRQKAARAWYLAAAEQGSCQAQIEIAEEYLSEGNISECLKWYLEAANQGCVVAANQLGSIYSSGKNVPVAFTQSFKWYMKAALRGNSTAQFEIGNHYAKGQGIDADPAEAEAWYLKAVEGGYSWLQSELAQKYETGDGIPKDLKKAATWYRKSAEQGDPNAELKLAEFLEQGIGIEKNLEEALIWYRKVAEKDNFYAQNKAAAMYFNGEGGKKDYKEAFKWFKKAAEKGGGVAQRNLGMMYRNGFGVKKNSEEAVKWYTKAAEQGISDAQMDLGYIFFAGEGVPKDYTEAFKWTSRAAEQKDADAQFNLAVHFQHGLGVPQDYVSAYAWFNLAATELDEAGKNREALARKMTPEQIAEAQKLSTTLAAKIAGPKEEAAPTEATPSTQPAGESVAKAYGTGFMVSASGYLVTSAHVIQGASQVKVIQNSKPVPAKVVSVDFANDVALLKAEGTSQAGNTPRQIMGYPVLEEEVGPFFCLPVISSGPVKLGAEVLTVGFPNVLVQGVSPKLTKGEISSLCGVKDDPRFFQISVPVQPGNSGGPLVDAQGNVVGLITGHLNESVAVETAGALPQNVNYAVKSSYFLPLLEAVPELADEMAKTRPNTCDTQESAIALTGKAVLPVLVY